MNIQPTSEDLNRLLETEEHCRMKLELIVLNRIIREQAAEIKGLAEPSPDGKVDEGALVGDDLTQGGNVG